MPRSPERQKAAAKERDAAIKQRLDDAKAAGELTADDIRRRGKVASFLRLYSDGLPIGQAKELSGWSAKTRTGRILDHARRLGMSEMLDKAGLNDDVLAQKVAAGSDAVKKVPIGKGEWVEDADWTNRHRYVETALAMKGHIVKGSAQAPSTQVNVALIGVNPDGVKGMLAGAFALMARSAGVAIDENALRAEVDAMSAAVLGGIGGDQIEVSPEEIQEAEIIEQIEQEELQAEDAG